MLKITAGCRGDARVLKLEGRIAEDGVDLLLREGREALQAGETLLLDLDGVTYVDFRGAELLRRWYREGTRLEGGSLYLRTVLGHNGVP